MDSLARTFHASLERLETDMQGKRGLLIGLLEQNAVDSENIELLRKDMAGIQDEIQREVIMHIKDIKQVLNHEQRERFFDLLRTGMEREGSHRLPEHRGK
jgi:Spy/CpxP family protein refolding chaperone